MTTRRAIIYTRVSSDPTRAGRSVAEQETECRQVCQREGWEVAQVLVDNDAGASRWSKSKRPSYEKLSTILRAGDVLVTWEASRAQRDLQAYLALRDLCAERGVLWSYSGRTYDLSAGDDRFTTGLDALLAEKEAEQTRERVLRALRSNAAQGKAHGRLAYGYKAVRDTETGNVIRRDLHPDHAPIVHEAGVRVLGGESLRSIAADFNDRKIPPASKRANSWRSVTIGKMLRRPTYAGKRTSAGKVVSDGNWPAIFTESEHLRLLAILDDPARRTLPRGTAPRHLLSGIAKCGICGAPMYVMTAHGKPVYYCTKGAHVSRQVADVEKRAVEYALALLSDPRLAERLSQPVDDIEAVRARNEADALRQRLSQITQSMVDGEISPRAFGVAESQLDAQIAELDERARHSVTHPTLARIAGENARAIWEGLDILDQREVLRAAVTVTVNLSNNGRGRRADEESIDVEWIGQQNN
ncbi:recombinase family protein [Rhodococcus qingshengii]|uniref:recombinase family protein n=1 Tax=Rhodococcus qingshengii TaxID=334542 RepID=UPI00072896EF|nr:recombinase family protein [Rhodococcus qingshengii]KSU77147.1 hypothetical protein AS032_14640 [Rhodococcus qingshengii]SCC37383.1 Site-specific DNA recombinase [Rhodococcus qingshengii]